MGETPAVRSAADKEAFRAACHALDLLEFSVQTLCARPRCAPEAMDLLLRLRAKIVELLGDCPARDDPCDPGFRPALVRAGENPPCA